MITTTNIVLQYFSDTIAFSVIRNYNLLVKFIRKGKLKIIAMYTFIDDLQNVRYF